MNNLEDEDEDLELSPERIEEIHKERLALERGEVAPAKVMEVTRDEDGVVTFAELDPEKYRKKQAAKHADGS